ncbi:MAG: aldolase [Thermococci archaeon]|nr:aldolase [Thermococci archaeon]
MSRLLKEQLIRYSVMAHQKGLTAAFGGNLSIRSGDLVFIKSTGTVMGELMRGHVATITMDAERTSAVRPSSEYRLHLRIYSVRPDVRAVVHLHPPFSIAVSALLRDELPLLTPEAEIYLRRIPVAPFREAGSEALAEVVASCIRDSDAVIMENHGTVTVGRSLREAFYKAELVEESAKLWYLSRQDERSHAEKTEERERERER